MTPTKLPLVFVSYSHDSEPHKQRVLALADRLRKEGVEAWIDQYVEHPSQGWPRWTIEQINRADFVLLICTTRYRRRWEQPDSSDGKGATWEAMVSQQILYDGCSRTDKLIPVVLGEGGDEVVPLVLRGFQRYQLMGEYEALYRRLTGQPRVPPQPVGSVVHMPPDPRPEPSEVTISDGEPRAAAVGEQVLEAAVEAILVEFRRTRDLAVALARGAESWTKAVARGEKALARTLLHASSPVELVDGIRDAMGELVVHRAATSRALADGMLGVLDHALPVVAGAWLAMEADASGRLTTDAEYPATVEPCMALHDGRPSEWYERAPGEPLEPRAHIALRGLPKSGAHVSRQAADIATSLRDGLEALALSSSRACGQDIKNFEDHDWARKLAIADRAMSRARSTKDPRRSLTFYAIADRKSGHSHEHPLIRLLAGKLPSLRVLVPRGEGRSTELDDELCLSLSDLNRTYCSIIQGHP